MVHYGTNTLTIIARIHNANIEWVWDIVAQVYLIILSDCIESISLNYFIHCKLYRLVSIQICKNWICEIQLKHSAYSGQSEWTSRVRLDCKITKSIILVFIPTTCRVGHLWANTTILRLNRLAIKRYHYHCSTTCACIIKTIIASIVTCAVKSSCVNSSYIQKTGPTAVVIAWNVFWFYDLI